METNDGKKGGLLKGKRHYDKSGKSLGGIKAIVTDTGQMVELEGGEVIINREASKKHWKELSKINQSAGDGVPILPPDTVEADADEYKLGGRTIEFNPNKIPNKWVYEYAKKIKDKYPKVWDLGGNQFGNEAFKNLERALKRGHWTDNEEWMFVKWQSFNARHKGDFRIAGVIANLKWLNKVDKGWVYMKSLIEKEIQKQYSEKKKNGGVVTYKNKYNKKYGYEKNESHDIKEIAKDTGVSKKGIQQIFNKGVGAYKTNPQSVRPNVKSKEQWAMARVYSSVMGGKAAKVDAKELKMAKGGSVKDIFCNSCGWGWDKNESEKHDEYVCHKCGANNKMKLGGNTELITPENKKFVTPTFVSEKELPRIVLDEADVDSINKIIQSVKLPFSVTEILGSGAYGTAFKTNRGTVLKVTGVTAEAFASYVISKSNFKSQAKVYNVFRVIDGSRDYYFIEKELVKVARDFYDEEKFPLNNLFIEAFSSGSGRVEKKFTNKRILELANDYYLEWVFDFEKEARISAVYKEGLKELKSRKKYIVEHLYNLFIFFRDLAKETGKKEISFNDVHTGNFGLSGNKFLCFDCVSSGYKSFMLGGELAKGIKAEKEHADTIKKIYEHKVPLNKAPELIAKDHLEEDKKYYTKLAQMETKYAKGSKVPESSVNVGDVATYLERGNTTPTKVLVISQRIAPRGNKPASVVQNLANGKKVEIYTDRLTKVGGAKSNMPDKPKYVTGQYVIFKTEKDLKLPYRVFKVSNGMGNAERTEWNYTLKEVANTGLEYYEVPESDLLDALEEDNLPFILADTIVNEKNQDMTIVKIDGGTIKFKDDNQNVIKYHGHDTWLLSDVLTNIVTGAWKLHKTGVIKPKALPQQPKIDLDLDFSINTPTGQKSRLNYLQQSLVRTDAFKKYFGDWENAAKEYIADNKENFYKHYKHVSKVLDLVTLEPRLMYHGTMTEKEFFVFDASRKNKTRPYSYFAQNKEYAEHFTQSPQRGSGDTSVLYQCFLRVIKPFNAIGHQYETKVKDAEYWLNAITGTIAWDKYNTIEKNTKTIALESVVKSQIGKYIEDICGSGEAPFWYFMARDKKSLFKAFLMSHDYDGINYAENLTQPYDINNPAEYTMAVTLFDSDQIKLGDGRNLDFDKLNPDIRYEDGGNLEQLHTETQATHKSRLGKLLFGETYSYKNETTMVIETPKVDSDRAYVDDIIAKMKA